ncbi:GMC family oxidoreductase, partial [Xanthomonas hortorum pv. gardneri]
MQAHRTELDTAEFSRRVDDNQRHLRKNLAAEYDYIICGSGTAGSGVARPPAQKPDITPLLLGAGGRGEGGRGSRAFVWFYHFGREGWRAFYAA